MPVDPVDARPLLSVSPNPGGQLDPSEVYGRSDKILVATKRLQQGRHLLLDEPRRFGKSSFARLLIRSWCENGGIGVYHSVQGHSSLVQFVESILGSVKGMPGAGRNAVAKALTDIVDGIDKIGAGPVSLSFGYERNPMAALRTAIANIDKVAEERRQRIVICLDEVTETIAEIGRSDGAGSARQLLGELRRIRETHLHVAWILTGSIGFHHVMRSIDTTSSMTNDMMSFPLGPLDDSWARWLGGSVLLGAGVDPALAEDEAVQKAVAKATDGIPMLIHVIGERVRDRDITVNAADVEGILDDCFRSSNQSHNLDHLLARLETYYDSTGEQARTVLDRIAAGPTTRADLTAIDGVDHRLLDSLEADHYLARDTDNRLVWKYPSLARLWRVRQGR